MKVTVNITLSFRKALKPLAKKYPSLLADLSVLEAELINNPKIGIHLGNNVYKIRLKISSNNRGKSGGARVISFVETDVVGQLDFSTEEETVNFLTIYDKAEMASISDKELKMLVNNVSK